MSRKPLICYQKFINKIAPVALSNSYPHLWPIGSPFLFLVTPRAHSNAGGFMARTALAFLERSMDIGDRLSAISVLALHVGVSSHGLNAMFSKEANVVNRKQL